MGKMFQNASSLKSLGQLKPNCPGIIIGNCSGGHLGFPIGIKNIKFVEDLPMIIPGQFFYVDRKSKMAATTIHRLTLESMGKCSNAFFSETTNMIKAKLNMNVHWMVQDIPMIFYF
jgi:hypothetical protein